MTDDFKFDVFLSHASKDKAAVRDIAERLRADMLKVWFDEWEIKPGDSIPSKIEEGLESSRVLVLCMSVHVFASDWARLESHTFRFRDPLNKERRFIPLRLDDSPIKGSLGQFLHVSWLPEHRELEYTKLLEACNHSSILVPRQTRGIHEQPAEKDMQVEYYDTDIRSFAFGLDGRRALSGGVDATVRLWDMETGFCLRSLDGHNAEVTSVAWIPGQRRALSSSLDMTVRLWDVETGSCLRTFDDFVDSVWNISLSPAGDQFIAASGYELRLWNVEAQRCLAVFRSEQGDFRSVALSADRRYLLSGNHRGALHLWDTIERRLVRTLTGHSNEIWALAWSVNREHALSGGADKTLQWWDTISMHPIRVFEGHTGAIKCLALTTDERFAISGSDDKTVRLWDLEAGRCLQVFEGHSQAVRALMWSADQQRVYSGDRGGGIKVWNMSEFMLETRRPLKNASAFPQAPAQVQYTNAKVLLVGDSGAGKTGLSTVLASQEWQPSDSTVGAWATQWKLPVSSLDGVEREIWLWDFGGQADQRLIHQLYMDETSLAVLVFDAQKDDLFETLGQWDRDLTRASKKPFSKLLVAGRVDAGGLRVSRSRIEAFASERGYSQFLETSAKRDIGCQQLRNAIIESIKWENIPWRSSPLLFKRLREEIIHLKDAGRVLMRFKELRETLQLRLSGEVERFTDDELKAVVSLLAGPGLVWELKFGSWVLLQPERINAYAQAVIQSLRADERERGCLPEERVLNGDLAYHSSQARLESDEEQFVLLAMHQTLVERGLCLREHSDTGPLLVFPSFYRRERPELIGHPAVLVSYRFNGSLDEIYATLVVRLHHTRPFEQDELWRYAADFKTLTGKLLGVKLTRRAEGAGELEVYFDPTIPMEEKIIFSKYVHEHLLRSASDVVRFRHYICPHCFTQVGNREVAKERLDDWQKNRWPILSVFEVLKYIENKPTIICSKCERRVPLWDDLEQSFASSKIQKRVLELQEESTIVLENESNERALVGEVLSTVALAGQLSREFNVSDHGLDMEIEFKLDTGEASGRKLYLQLKSRDSFLTHRKSYSSDVFYIKDESIILNWMEKHFPVLLVIRDADGTVRWMDVQNWLKGASNDDKKPVKRIDFEGERFDVMSVRRWRDKVLGMNFP